MGTIEINGGNIEAYGSGMAAGIGGGLEGGIGTIVINGGTVYARADMEATPGILKMYTVEQELAVERPAAWIGLKSTVAM